MGLSIILEEGVEYVIAGVCDQACSDLDLALTGEDDAFTVWVTMYACSVEPCSFAYQVYRR